MMTSKMNHWPVIFHNKFERTDLVGILRNKNMKIRVSDSILPDTVIFPLSGVAFMLLSASDVVDQSGTLHDLYIERINKFTQVHRMGYILLRASLHGDNEYSIINQIQRRYLASSLQILPVHNTSDVVQAMMTIAKLLCKPTCDVMRSRFNSILCEDVVLDGVDDLLLELDLNIHQIQVMKDRLGSLDKIVTASRDDLLDCSLDSQTVNKITSFFNKS